MIEALVDRFIPIPKRAKKILENIEERKEKLSFLRQSIEDQIKKINSLENKADIYNKAFELAVRNSGIGFTIVNCENGQLLYVNPALVEILGRPVAELNSSSWRDLTPPEDRRMDQECVNKCLSGELDSYEMHKRYYHPDGHYIYAILDVSIIRTDSGVPVFFVSQIQDVDKIVDKSLFPRVVKKRYHKEKSNGKRRIQ